MSGRDANRAAAYTAEDQLCALLERGGRVDFHGSTLDLPQERRFGDIAGVQRYLDLVRRAEWSHGPTPAPVVRRRKGQTRAAWHPPNVIAVPDRTTWALREVVVLHEYAHHVNAHENGATGHDREFCRIHVELVSGALSESAGLVLLAAYHETGCYG